MAPTAPMMRNVVLIDDEAPLRTIVRRMLEPDVCCVLEAPDAEAGLRLIEQDDPPIHAVLTDWIMPGLHGLDVVEVLDRYRPDLPVVVISAFTSTIHPIIRRGPRFSTVQKPFTCTELQATVSSLVFRRRDTRSQTQGARMDLVTAAWAMHRSRGH